MLFFLLLNIAESEARFIQEAWFAASLKLLGTAFLCVYNNPCASH